MDKIDIKGLSVFPLHVKRNMKYWNIPEEDSWKEKVVKDLLELRWNLVEIEVLEEDTGNLENLVSQLYLGWWHNCFYQSFLPLMLYQLKSTITNLIIIELKFMGSDFK